MTGETGWLSITRDDAPLIVSIPHAGTEIPSAIEAHLVSGWLARKDTDWWVDQLYDFAPALGATVIRTQLSRSVIDVNRDPSGRSLYPGQNTTQLCPTTTFDGEELYSGDGTPDSPEVERRRAKYFDPYHAALKAEIRRLSSPRTRLVVFEAHSIRSRVPRLFDGKLPHFNIGTNSGASCAPELTEKIESICDGATESAPPFIRVTNGRFKGGYTTRHYGAPEQGIHAVQLELAIRAYMDEPEQPTPENWPGSYSAKRAAAMRQYLQRILKACLGFARGA